MRQLEVLQPRAVIFKGASDHIFIPGVNDMTPEFEADLAKHPAWQKQIDRLAGSKIARVLQPGEKGQKFDASDSPFGVSVELGIKIVEAQSDVPTLRKWLRSPKAKGALKKAIEEQIALMTLEAGEQKS